MFSFWGLSNSHFTFVERDVSGTGLTQHPPLRLLNYKGTIQNLLSKPQLKEEGQRQRQNVLKVTEEFSSTAGKNCQGCGILTAVLDVATLSSEGSVSIPSPAFKGGQGRVGGRCSSCNCLGKSGPL